MIGRLLQLIRFSADTSQIRKLNSHLICSTVPFSSSLSIRCEVAHVRDRYNRSTKSVEKPGKKVGYRGRATGDRKIVVVGTQALTSFPIAQNLDARSICRGWNSISANLLSFARCSAVRDEIRVIGDVKPFLKVTRRGRRYVACRTNVYVTCKAQSTMAVVSL